jgi:hypothetical protein
MTDMELPSVFYMQISIFPATRRLSFLHHMKLGFAISLDTIQPINNKEKMWYIYTMKYDMAIKKY